MTGAEGGDDEDIGHPWALRGSGGEQEGDITKGELGVAMAGMILDDEFRQWGQDERCAQRALLDGGAGSRGKSVIEWRVVALRKTVWLHRLSTLGQVR